MQFSRSCSSSSSLSSLTSLSFHFSSSSTRLPIVPSSSRCSSLRSSFSAFCSSFSSPRPPCLPNPSSFPRSFSIAASRGSSKKYFLLCYDYIEHILEKRAPHRSNHLALAKQWVADGNLLYGGAFDPPNGALLMFHCSDRSVVEKFASLDPYVKNGLVTKYEIKDWTVVITPQSV